MASTQQLAYKREYNLHCTPLENFTVEGELYSIDIPGCDTNSKNRLRLFDLKSVQENIVQDGIQFDKEDIRQNLTLFLISR